MVVRKATKEDLQNEEKLKERAVEYLELCKERVRSRELPMKMVGSRFTEGGKKLILFFTADGRIDFRALVKELAQTLKVRIELRQIGARDGSKYAGCMGPCGRTTCCSTFLRHFQSISVGMAKNQKLSPNPTKLTGMCNKLKCCLAYENSLYDEYRKEIPSEEAGLKRQMDTEKFGIQEFRRKCVTLSWTEVQINGCLVLNVKF